MKQGYFWLKLNLLFLVTLVLFSLVAAGLFSHYHAEKENENISRQIDYQSRTWNQQLNSKITQLVKELVEWKEGDPTTFFQDVGVIDNSYRKPILVHSPRWIQTFRQIYEVAPQLLKNKPVAFYPTYEKGKNSNQVFALLVNLEKLKSPQLKKQQFRVGIMNKKGQTLLASVLDSKVSWQSFIMDGSMDYLYLHSNQAYSGLSLSAKSPYQYLKKRYPAGWIKELHRGEILSVGVPLSVTGSYLVMNQPLTKAIYYFEEIFLEVLLAMSLIGFLMQGLFFLLLNPLREAYEYLTQTFKQYTVLNSIPTPNYDGKNVWIREIQPTLRKMFWQLREEKIQEEDPPSSTSISEMIERLSKKMTEKYPEISIKFQCNEDLALLDNIGWVEQSVYEILKNAVESMRASGKIDIRSYKKDEWFYLDVRDYGMGVEPSVLKHAHKAYYSSKQGAKGLGLTLGMSALSRLGGQLQLSNATDGQGLIASIQLPLIERSKKDMIQRHPSSYLDV